jgi:hypothetical protein
MRWNKMMQKSTTFTTIFRVKNVPVSLRYAKKIILIPFIIGF